MALLAACSPGSAENVPTSSGDRPDGASNGLWGGTPVEGGDIKIAVLGKIDALNPHTNSSYAATNFTNNIIDRLVFQDRDTGAFSPWLATKWEYNADFTEFTFTLREDVTFSDGTKFNAQSVVNNLDRIVKGDVALGWTPVGTTYIGPYKEATVVSEYVVKISFTAPNSSFLQATANSGTGGISFLSDKTLQLPLSKLVDPANVHGTGPFVVTEYKPNETATLTRRDDYKWAPAALAGTHTGPAYLHSITYVTTPEASVRVGSLQSGAVDIAYDILPTDEPTLTASGYALTYETNPGFCFVWQFNLSLPGTDDIAVRRAIVAATDRAGYKRTLLSNSEQQAKSVITHNVQGWADYSETALKYDLEAAKKYLDDAGWVLGPDGVRAKNGVKLNLKANGNNLVPDSTVTYQAAQAALKSIGINVEFTENTAGLSVEEINRTYHLRNINRGRGDAAVINTTLNPERGNGALIPKDFPDRQKIVDRFQKIDTVIGDDRLPVIKDLQDLVLQDYVLVNPTFEPSQIAATKNVYNIYQDAADRLLFYNAYLKK